MLQRIDEVSVISRHLQTKYGELRAQFMMLRNRFYLIECAWCQRRIGWKRKEGSVPSDTSHGICPPCAADMERDIARLQVCVPFATVAQG